MLVSSDCSALRPLQKAAQRNFDKKLFPKSTEVERVGCYTLGTEKVAASLVEEVPLFMSFEVAFLEIEPPQLVKESRIAYKSQLLPDLLS